MRSENADAFGLRLACLAILANFEANLVAVTQRAALLQGRNVNENVWTAIVRRDEAKALVFSEKFNRTGRHDSSSLIVQPFDSRAEPIVLVRAYQRSNALLVQSS